MSTKAQLKSRVARGLLGLRSTALALFVTSAAFSQGGAAAEPATRSALFGTWSVDTTRLPMPAPERPRSVTITFSEESPGHVRARYEIVAPTGDLLEAEGVTPLDGTPTAVKANFEADVSATSMPRPEVLVMQLAKEGVPASTRIYAVLPGGDHMIETVAYFSADGRPALRNNYFSRVR